MKTMASRGPAFPVLSSWFSSTSSDDGGIFQRTVYVHPLSQIILEYFQGSRFDWIHQKGLERSLVLHRDGSFEMKFPTSDEEISPSDIVSAQKSSVNKIWTAYDEQDKKHWLTVQKGHLHERYLLQDNLASAWHANRRSLPERIHTTVEEMIRAIDQIDVLTEQERQEDGEYRK
jgi:hypothetical protein